jgi:hypothetical protein
MEFRLPELGEGVYEAEMVRSRLVDSGNIVSQARRRLYFFHNIIRCDKIID